MLKKGLPALVLAAIAIAAAYGGEQTSENVAIGLNVVAGVFTLGFFMYMLVIWPDVDWGI